MKARRSILFLLASVLLGVALRCAVTFKESPDCVYHLRRARFALQHFPRTIFFDPITNFPDGGICVWPPLFDLSLALPSLLWNGTDTALASFEQSAMWIPIFYAAGAVAAAGMVGALVRRRWGIAAGLFVAISPGHIQYSQFGHTDQHVAESFFGALLLGFFLWSCKRSSRWIEFACGLSLAFAVLTWQGAIFWAPLIAAALIAEVWREKQSSAGVPPARSAPTKLPRHFKRPMLILGLPTLLTATATHFWISGFDWPFSYVSFGWFQPVFLSAMLAAVLLTTMIRTKRIVFFPFFLLAVLPALLFWKQLSAGVWSGILHIFSSTPGSDVVSGGFSSLSKEWLSQILEYRPLLADQWDWPIGFLSFSFFLSPLVFLLWLIRLRSQPRRTAFYVLLLAWGVFIFFFTLMQRRNVYYAALLGAVSAVELSAFAAVWLKKRFIEGPASTLRPIFAVCFAVFLLPMLLRLPEELRSGYSAEKDRLEVLHQVKRIVPQEVNPYDERFLSANGKVPELNNAHSVMAFWSQGHLVTYFSERPVVANNFGFGFMDSLNFFLAKSEEEALAIAQRRRVQYVFSLDIFPVINQYSRVVGQPDYLLWTGDQWKTHPAYFQTLQARLHDFDGNGGQLESGIRVEPLRTFRLRFASQSGMVRFGRRISKFKVFEIVR